MGTNLAHTELGNFGFSYITPNLVCFAESTSGDISSLAVALIRTSYCMGVSVSDRNVAILVSLKNFICIRDMHEIHQLNYQVTAILLWVLAEGLREWFGVQADALRMAASDFVKSGACLALWVIQRRTAVNGSFRELSTEEQPLNDIVPSPDDDAPDDNDLNGRETWPPSTSASLGTGSVNFQSAFIAVLIGGIFSFRTLVVGLRYDEVFVSAHRLFTGFQESGVHRCSDLVSGHPCNESMHTIYTAHVLHPHVPYCLLACHGHPGAHSRMCSIFLINAPFFPSFQDYLY